MEQPETLLFPNENGDMYTVSSSYEDLKSSITLQKGLDTWNEVLKMWYRELLFNYKFEESMNELKRIGALNDSAQSKYSLDDLHNSLAFIRTKVVKELGNGAISNLNEDVQAKWRAMERQANSATNK